MLSVGLVSGVIALYRGSSGLGGSSLVFHQTKRKGGHDLTGSAISSDQIDSRLAESKATVGGELEISLAWNTTSDLDIEVVAPSGERVYAYNWRAQCGGVQDVDANPTALTLAGSSLYTSGRPPGAENVIPLPDFMFDLDKQISGSGPWGIGGFGGLEDLMAGDGSKPPSRYTRTPIEHIYFQTAPKGTYVVYASCFSWREKSRMSIPFTVQVKSRGREALTVTDTIGPSSYCADGTGSMKVCQFDLK